MKTKLLTQFSAISAMVILFGCETKKTIIETKDIDYKQMTETEQGNYINTYPCLKRMSETPYLVLFANGKYSIPDKYHCELDKTANCLKAHKHVSIIVEGYASQIGSTNFNAVLSEKRAEVVKQALIKRGVDANNISTYGFGVMVKHIPSHWDKSIESYNRRVNITPFSDGFVVNINV